MRLLKFAVLVFLTTLISLVSPVMSGLDSARAASIPVVVDSSVPPPYHTPPTCEQIVLAGSVPLVPGPSCPSGTPPGCYDQVSVHDLLVYKQVACPGALPRDPNPQRDTRSTLGPPKNFCDKNLPDCIRASPCPLASGGSGIWTSTGVTPGRPTWTCVAQPPAPNIVQQQPAQTPAKFCAANPGKCQPPNGMAVSFCALHPEQCSMPDAFKPQTGNPAAQEQRAR
jgi:hypothetical protein